MSSEFVAVAILVQVLGARFMHEVLTYVGMVSVALSIISAMVFLSLLLYGLVGACVLFLRKSYIWMARLVSTVNTSVSKTGTPGSNPGLSANAAGKEVP